MAGKGDKPRSVDKKRFDENFESIFRHKKRDKKGKKRGRIKIFKKTY